MCDIIILSENLHNLWQNFRIFCVSVRSRFYLSTKRYSVCNEFNKHSDHHFLKITKISRYFNLYTNKHTFRAGLLRIIYTFAVACVKGVLWYMCNNTQKDRIRHIWWRRWVKTVGVAKAAATAHAKSNTFRTNIFINSFVPHTNKWYEPVSCRNLLWLRLYAHPSRWLHESVNIWRYQLWRCVWLECIWKEIGKCDRLPQLIADYVTLHGIHHIGKRKMCVRFDICFGHARWCRGWCVRR